MSNGIIAGPASVRISVPNVNLPNLRVSGTTSVKPSRFSNEALDGGGFSRRESNSYLEVEIRDSADLPLRELENICGDGGVVSARFVTGKAYALSNPVLVGDITTSDEGTIALRFESDEAAEEALGA